MGGVRRKGGAFPGHGVHGAGSSLEAVPRLGARGVSWGWSQSRARSTLRAAPGRGVAGGPGGGRGLRPSMGAETGPGAGVVPGQSQVTHLPAACAGRRWSGTTG